MPTSTSDIVSELRKRAGAEGLSGPRITVAHLEPVVGERLEIFLDEKRNGSMAWLEDRKDQRKSPDTLWPEARSAIVFAQNYGQNFDAMDRLQRKSEGVISVYALNRDYHDLFKGKLKRLAQWLHYQTAEPVKVFVDTAPVMEKPLAEQAGLGWQGKHTNLVSRELGSWFFIGTILTSAELPHDAPETDHCGTCSACLDICPTKAFPAPRQLDARRCISYLTIEHTGHIDVAFRKAMGNRIYGCDDCLAVCPWNKFAQASRELKLVAREDLVSPQLGDLLKLDDDSFRKLFTGSPVKRTGRDRFVRNCLIAAGNSGDAALLPAIQNLLDDPSAIVRAMAAWGLQQLADPVTKNEARRHYAHKEDDPDVLKEWTAP
jgi:epoxyqueuosine reductase